MYCDMQVETKWDEGINYPVLLPWASIIFYNSDFLLEK